MENLLPIPPKGKKAIEEELIRGREMANQLLEVLTHKSNTHHVEDDKMSKSSLLFPFAEDLVREVLKSLINTLLLLNNVESKHVAALPPITVGDSSLPVEYPKLEEDLDGKSLNTQNPRSQSNKRKSIAPTWEKNTSILIDDGHAWRKYGQKRIMKSKHLRSYYRCTHMSDQHCKAIKHVQQIQEDPPFYRTVYYNHHSCKSSFNPDIILEPILSSDSSIFLSFDNNIPCKKECGSVPAPLLATTKREPMEVVHDDHFVDNQLISSENFLLRDFEVYFNCLEHATLLSSSEYVEFQNVYGKFGF